MARVHKGHKVGKKAKVKMAHGAHHSLGKHHKKGRKRGGHKKHHKK